MARPPVTERGGWPPLAGAAARVLAFIALALALTVVLGRAWLLLPLPATDAAAYLGTIVTAAAALLAGAVMIRFADGRHVAALGVGVSRVTAAHLGLGIAIGAAALLLAAAGMLLAGALHYEAQPGRVTDWLLVVAGQAVIFWIAALAEEALFRGYAFQVLARSAGPIAATLLTSALFAAAHGSNPEVGVMALVNIFLAGVLLAVAYLRTLSLWFVTAVHTGWNWCMASLLDLPVSGITVFDTPGYQPRIGGPDWWSGGAFGPEAGLVGTLGFGFALLLMFRLRAVRPDPRIAAAGALVLDRERVGA